MSEDLKQELLVTLKSAASTDDPKVLYNVLVGIPRSDRYRCLYSLDREGMNLLEWVRSFAYESP